MNLYNQIEETTAFLSAQLPDFQPQVAIILGTGLNGLCKEINILKQIDYADIPHFLISTVETHSGKLYFATLSGVEILVLAGRFHYYEGYDSQQTTFPIRVLKALKIKRLIITNAVGSVNSDINAGDLVLIKDHINLQPENPLRGKNDERLGLRFPDMLFAYDANLNKQCLAIAQKNKISAHIGVYVATQGPNLETPAEYKFFNIIGADVVGMSAVAEVLVARHSELPVLVISVVSNKCFPIENIEPTTVQTVIETVQKAEPKLTFLIQELLKQAIF
jgi:purine-nucleoside phosphorylase